MNNNDDFEIDNNTSDSEILERALNDICPQAVRRARGFVNNFKPDKDEFNDTLVAQAYTVARKYRFGSMSKLARQMNMDLNVFEYYMKTYPEFASAIQIGLIDCKNDIKAELTESIYNRALGLKIKEEKIEDKGVLDDEGCVTYVRRTKTSVTKDVPPDANAALELLRKMDPSWNPKSSLEVNYLGIQMNVAEDRNIQVDYRKLSPDALKQLLLSDKTTPKNSEVYKKEDGESTISLLPSKQPEYQSEENIAKRQANFERIRQEKAAKYKESVKEPKKIKVINTPKKPRKWTAAERKRRMEGYKQRKIQKLKEENKG